MFTERIALLFSTQPSSNKLFVLISKNKMVLYPIAFQCIFNAKSSEHQSLLLFYFYFPGKGNNYRSIHIHGKGDVFYIHNFDAYFRDIKYLHFRIYALCESVLVTYFCCCVVSTQKKSVFISLFTEFCHEDYRHQANSSKYEIQMQFLLFGC